MSQINRIAVLTSGGDAPGMNAAIRALVFAAAKHKIEVIGIKHGYNGLLEEDTMELNKANVHGIIRVGGTILKSARCKDMYTPEGMKKAAATLDRLEIDALVVIGGDGSFTGLHELSEYWDGLTIGIPGTIDNDVDGTDNTIGFATAVNTAIEAIDKIRDTADAFERIFVIELMGKHSGFITFYVGISCAAEQVLSFENTNFDCDKDDIKTFDHIVNSIKRAQKNNHGSYIIVMAENLIEGGAHALSQRLNGEGVESTACTLGHIQRGGAPVAKDRILGTKMGVFAIQALLSGESKKMIAEVNHTMQLLSLESAVRHQKQVNQSLIDAQSDILAITG